MHLIKNFQKYKPQFRDKSRIESAIQKSISIKNHYLSKIIKLKDTHIRIEAQIKYKKYRNLNPI